ncbi:transposase [Actinomadura citrea]|uniref:Transposase n=1 Tax=Actinomadura citrea TaxID=46158 RepID=A0A7Y9GJ76_9ACTN|nr:transposase [Actinomadura citrea]
MPARYGPWPTLYQQLRRWSVDGTWDRPLTHVQVHDDAIGAVDWSAVCVGSNVVERCFNQLKRFRGLATRYKILAAHYRAVVTHRQPCPLAQRPLVMSWRYSG